MRTSASWVRSATPPSASSSNAARLPATSGASAASPRCQRRDVALRTNPARNAAVEADTRPGPRASGESRSARPRSPSRRSAGSGSGTAIAGARYPALPQDAPAPTVARSRTVTSAPCRCRCQAHESPTTPAPTTTTWRAGRVFISASSGTPTAGGFVRSTELAADLPVDRTNNPSARRPHNGPSPSDGRTRCTGARPPRPSDGQVARRSPCSWASTSSTTSTA